MPLPIMIFSKAILREVPDTYRNCLSSHPLHDNVNVHKAQVQHEQYKNALNDLGIETIVLPKLNQFPDSCFVEDNALLSGKRAFISRMGVSSRMEETQSIVDVLQEFFEIKKCVAPGTIEGGDVIHLPDAMISGLSLRTNLEGVKQAEMWLGKKFLTIDAPDIMHLKSYVTYIGENTFVSTKRFASHPVLQNFNVIVVPKGEEYGANTLTMNGTVLLSSHAPKLKNILETEGFETLSLEMTQFEYCNGALTCLSLRF
ncbi:MAG: hypothetical protein D6732_08600 [Methanobacteriota archaeon]|nr:MAG: hypothetical protein D6732_08600 [Euryarchaeota archaeon]